MIRLLDGSDERTALLKAERFAVSQIRKYIGGRYDCDTIFAATGDLRDDYIIMITIDIALYHLWSKKAPKQVPEHRKERYAGEMPTDLPQLPTDSYRGDLRIYSLHKPNDNKY